MGRRPSASSTPREGHYPNEDVLRDPTYVGRKAAKIAAILRDALGSDLAQAVGLDVGCAAGGITALLAPSLRAMVAVEYDADHLAHVPAGDSRCLVFVRGDAQRLPIADSSVDVVICAQVYEHVADVRLLVSEIGRVLAPGGVCFFSGPNRWDPIERHYGLPFLSWLPRSLADRYVRATGRGEQYAERPLSYRELRRLLCGFIITDYTVAMLRDPARFCCEDEMRGALWVRRLPRSLLTFLLPLIPNYDWILSKRGENLP